MFKQQQDIILQKIVRKNNRRAPKTNSDTKAFPVSRELFPLTFLFFEERKYHIVSFIKNRESFVTVNWKFVFLSVDTGAIRSRQCSYGQMQNWPTHRYILTRPVALNGLHPINPVPTTPGVSHSSPLWSTMNEWLQTSVEEIRSRQSISPLGDAIASPNPLAWSPSMVANDKRRVRCIESSLHTSLPLLQTKHRVYGRGESRWLAVICVSTHRHRCWWVSSSMLLIAVGACHRCCCWRSPALVLVTTICGCCHWCLSPVWHVLCFFHHFWSRIFVCCFWLLLFAGTASW